MNNPCFVSSLRCGQQSRTCQEHKFVVIRSVSLLTEGRRRAFSSWPAESSVGACARQCKQYGWSQWLGVCLSANLEISVALLHINEIRVGSIVCLTCQSSFPFQLLSFCVFVVFFPSQFFLSFLTFISSSNFLYMYISCLSVFSLYMFPLSIFVLPPLSFISLYLSPLSSSS